MHQDEVKSLFKSDKDGDISLGLITVDRTVSLYGFKDVYTFLHLTFQEYLAAHHIFTLSDEEQDKLIREYGPEKHMLAVWKFYCGLATFMNNKRFKALLQNTAGRNLFHIQCAYESQLPLTCAQLLKNTGYHIEIADKCLTTPDFTAIGYVINNSIFPITLSLTKCRINIEVIDPMLLQMKDRKRLLLQNLQLESCDIEMEYIKRLLTNFKSVKKLNNLL